MSAASGRSKAASRCERSECCLCGWYSAVDAGRFRQPTAESNTFGVKWHRATVTKALRVLTAVRDWLLQRYGSPEEMPWLFAADTPQILLDAGCGSALSALELFGERLNSIHYVGVDISTAVDVAAERCAKARHRRQIHSMRSHVSAVCTAIYRRRLFRRCSPPHRLNAERTPANRHAPLAGRSLSFLRLSQEGADPRVHGRLRPRIAPRHDARRKPGKPSSR